MDLENIRNFSIIAHIDHGKSTLADRLLESTSTIETRKMRDQVLDRMDLERERGITIKMQPVTMRYCNESAGVDCRLNLIDTPGHIDFAYEVSRSLKAVEGVILLVDSSQGVQAQTLSVLDMARDLNLAVIPVMSKIDMPTARPEMVRMELSRLLKVDPSTILKVSGKTGEGVDELLSNIAKYIPPPKSEWSATDSSRSLVFDFDYSNHRGIIVYVRVLDGAVKPGDQLKFLAADEQFSVLQTGIFGPDPVVQSELLPGQIGYVVTGIKRRGRSAVGDTLTAAKKPLPPVVGYQVPRPVIWASIYPDSHDNFDLLRQGLERLQLADAALSFEEEASGSLGRGFRCGFLGMLHLEIITERLRREYKLSLVVASPTICYQVQTGPSGEFQTIYSPIDMPDLSHNVQVSEQWVTGTVITPIDHWNAVAQIMPDYEAAIMSIDNFGDDRMVASIEMPLRELMRGFFDKLKSCSAGFASLSYELGPWRPADVVKMEVLVADEVVPAFTRVVARRRVNQEAESAVDKLKSLLPKQLIVVKVQARANGRVIASRSISALRKDVTGYLYGGDVTRKRKLLEKQKKGKKKMQSQGRVNIPQSVFLQMVRSENQALE